MRNLKVNIFKATAVFLVILAAVFYYFEQIKVPETIIETTEVIVATTDISENSVIKKEMVTIEKRYAEDVMKLGNIVKTYDEIVGKRTVVPIYKGEAINNNRVIENKSYMNSEDQTQIALSLNEADKALSFNEGDYIDVWLEPISQGQNTEVIAEPYKLIKRLKIIKVHDSNYNVLNQQKAVGTEGIISNSVYVPAYLTIELSDTVLKELYSIDKNKYNIRITRYGEEKLFNTVIDIIDG